MRPSGAVGEDSDAMPLGGGARAGLPTAFPARRDAQGDAWLTGRIGAPRRIGRRIRRLFLHRAPILRAGPARASGGRPRAGPVRRPGLAPAASRAAPARPPPAPEPGGTGTMTWQVMLSRRGLP